VRAAENATESGRFVVMAMLWFSPERHAHSGRGHGVQAAAGKMEPLARHVYDRCLAEFRLIVGFGGLYGRRDFASDGPLH
jgi:hypothetical protein